MKAELIVDIGLYFVAPQERAKTKQEIVYHGCLGVIPWPTQRSGSTSDGFKSG